MCQDLKPLWTNVRVVSILNAYQNQDLGDAMNLSGNEYALSEYGLDVILFLLIRWFRQSQIPVPLDFLE
jgi:hypothetical protein